MENSIKYKVPGGKLLMVRAAWNEKITKLELLGDFFVHPEEALNEIEGLLVGMRADSDEAELSNMILQFVEQNGVTLIGLHPGCDSKGGQDGGGGMRWRFVELEARDACSNMAIDQAVMEGVAERLSEPTIRFYRWLPSAVSIGRFQSMKEEVDIGKCAELGISCVRRITGGGAVYHDYDGEITYSVIAPERCFPKGIRESYALICGWVVSGLSNIGIRGGVCADKRYNR